MAAVGYSDGLEEVIERLGRTVAAITATDVLTGLISVDEVGRRLSVQLERSGGQGSAWALTLGVAADAAVRAADLREFLHRCAGTLAGGLRRYDVPGLAGDAEFAVLLPDITRYGVQAVLERLRRALAGGAPSGPEDRPLLCGRTPRRGRCGRGRPPGAARRRHGPGARRRRGRRLGLAVEPRLDPGRRSRVE